MAIHHLATLGLAINTYIIIDPSSQKAAVVDATCDIKPILELLNREGATLSAILESHVHADFMSGSKLLKWAIDSNPKIYCSSSGGKTWLPEYADVGVDDKFEIPLGSLRMQARHSPGHTPEHLMWVVFDDLIDPNNPLASFTGDFLLIGTVGRPDLLGETEVKMLANYLYDSVFTLLPQFPDNMEIFPAHGFGSFCGKGISSKTVSTLTAERQSNMFLVPKDRDLWTQSLLANMPPAPSYFKRIKKMNLKGPRLESDMPPSTWLTVEELSKKHEKDYFVLDVRNPIKFASGHIVGAVNIPLAPSFINWATIVVPYDTPLTIVVEEEKSLEQANVWLRIVGFDEFRAIVFMTDMEREKSVRYFHSFPIYYPIDVFQLLMNNPDDICIIDVRTLSEWRAGHIADAIHIELANIAVRCGELPKNKRLGLICGSGYRSSIAASLLCKAGFKDVFNVNGGMQNWIKQGLPTSDSQPDRTQ